MPLLPDEPHVAPSSDPYVRIREQIESADARLNPDEDDLALADEFLIPTEAQREAGREFARRILGAAVEMALGELRVPRFGSGGDGSIGLHWRSAHAEMLIVLPPRPDDQITYYGDTPDGAEVKGSIGVDDPIGFIAEWLAEYDRPKADR